VPVAGHKGRGKNQVEGLMRIKRQRLARVFIGLYLIAFRVPVDGQVAVSQRQRKLLGLSFHQVQAFFEVAFMDRHLAQSMQRHGA